MSEGSEVREADPLGIVVEGGGCRAIYAAGVLDVFDAAEPLMREVKGVLASPPVPSTPRASSRASAAEAFGSTSASRRTSASGASAGGFAPDA